MTNDSVRHAVAIRAGEVVAKTDGMGGARFTVALPPVVAPAADEAASQGERPPSVGLDGLHVLVLEDDDDARELMATLLQQRGAVVTTAADVRAAVLAFDDTAPHVVISDIAMPGRGGLDLVRELRTRKNAAAMFVAVSGFASPEEVEVALGAGFDMHLAKPIDANELIALIHDASRARTR
jgi:CheY-like chemotaxis protein